MNALQVKFEKVERKHSLVADNNSNGVRSNILGDISIQQEVFPLERSTVTSFHIQNDESMQEMKDDTTVVEEDLNKLNESTSNFRKSRGENECKENSSENINFRDVMPDEALALATRRLELQAQAVEEIRAAREYKQAELMRLVRDREEARQKRLREEEELKNEAHFKGDIPFADPFADSFATQEKALDHIAVERQPRVDVKLSDIQVMQSIILAEEAGLEGKDEFKTVEHLHELDSTQMLFHNKMSTYSNSQREYYDCTGSESKEVALQRTARISKSPGRAKLLVATSIKRISNRAKCGISAIKFNGVRRNQQVYDMKTPSASYLT